MISAFFLGSVRPVRARSGSVGALTPCLVLLSVMLLGACATSSDEEDAAAQARYRAQTVARQEAQRKRAPPQPVPSPYTDPLSSRLQSQPWPPGIGQPLSQGAMTALPPSAMPPMHSNPAIAAPALYGQANAPVPAARTAVAILLPLSGKNAALGQAMLNAAQMAVFDLAAPDFELMPRDTKGTPDGAAAAARDALSAGAQLLIGPLFAADVAAVKPIAASAGVNMLALSTDVSLGAPGSWVMGFAPAPQVERVIGYARHQGLYHFAAIIPPTPYGAIIRAAFERTVQATGGAATIIDNAGQLAALAAKGNTVDALLLPLGGAELRTTLTQLAAAGFDKNRTHLLGTGLWDEPGLGQSLDLLTGGWYAASEPEARERFAASYAKTYHAEPPRLATLAYDATALPAVLSRRSATFDRNALASPNGFAGLDGIFRLTPQGTAERGLAVNEITAGGSRVIDPAPSVFAGTN